MPDSLTPFDLYIPITRVDDEERLVEGYCYVNADVGDGWNLKRTAMEKAAAAYMQFPAVREMHDKKAAGSAEAVSFDDKGCFIRARVVDEDAWRKVKEKVYRGFSVGGKPTFARGRDIEEFEWIETSLVDRPADRSATFTLFRLSEAVHTPPASVPSVPSASAPPAVQSRDPSTVHRHPSPSQSVTANVRANRPQRNLPPDVHQPDGGQFAPPPHPDASQPDRGQFAPPLAAPPLLVPSVPSVTSQDAPSIDPALQRIQALERDRSSLLERIEALTATVERERADRLRAEERCEALKRSPAPAVRPPVRFAGALREFLLNGAGSEDQAEAGRLRAELQYISDHPAPTQPVRDRQIARVMEIKQELRDLGATVD